jgi:hypothetical protein
MSLAGLKTVDVDRRRADRLRARCLASLRARTHQDVGPATRRRDRLQRAVASALAAAWCAVYLLEVIRRVVVVYGL